VPCQNGLSPEPGLDRADGWHTKLLILIHEKAAGSRITGVEAALAQHDGGETALSLAQALALAFRIAVVPAEKLRVRESFSRRVSA